MIGDKANGGYVAVWIDAEHFTPKSHETVLIHMKAWNSYEWGIGNYIRSENVFLILGGETVGYSDVDYWMHIPRIP